MGSRKACEMHAKRFLDKKLSIVIDRCNFDEKQRKTWIDLGQKYNVPVDCIVLTTTEQVWPYSLWTSLIQFWRNVVSVYSVERIILQVSLVIRVYRYWKSLWETIDHREQISWKESKEFFTLIQVLSLIVLLNASIPFFICWISVLYWNRWKRTKF